MLKVIRVTRTLHTWLGLLLLPWIIFFGITGFYLNHQNLVLNLLPSQEIDQSVIENLPVDRAITLAAAASIANNYWADEKAVAEHEVTYHGYQSWRFTKPSGYILVSKSTGHYYVKSNYMRSTYSPEGKRLHTKIYWGYIFGLFHRTGWLNWSLKTVLADIVSLSLIAFGASGLLTWYLPKHKRLMRKLFRS